MRKLLSLTLASGLALLAACSDPQATSPESPFADGSRRNVVLPKCETLDNPTVNRLIVSTYRYVGLDTTLGQTKWAKISAGSTDDAWNMAREVLAAKQGRGLKSTSDMVRLINQAFCRVGLPVGFPGGDAWVVSPSSTATQTFVTTDQQAAFVLPPNSVDQLSLLAITSTSDTLNTNLDKYPIVRNFSKYPSNLFPQNNPAQVYICGSVDNATPNASGILNRLRLGHNLPAGGFEILNPVQMPTGLLSCNESILAAAPPSLLQRAIDLILPKYLLAQTSTTRRGTSGVGGNVSNLSPIGPVDPRIIPVAASELTQSAPAGTTAPSSPAIQLITASGRPLANIPVTFTRTAGGSITPANAVSTTSGIAATTSWTLTVGTNSVSATPATGGSAVTNTLFEPASISFSATGTSTTVGTATSMQLSGGPVANATYTAGAALPTLTVSLKDAAGQTATSFTGTVRVTSTTTRLAGTTSVNAVRGVATFNNLQALGAGRPSLTVSATVGTTTISRVTSTFIVVAAAPDTLTLVSGNGTRAVVGSSPTAFPTVQAKDRFGNIVRYAPIYFGPSNNSATPTSPVFTDTLGRASTSWPLEYGANRLMASLDAPVSPLGAARRYEFSSDGTSSAESFLLSCTKLGTATSILTRSARWAPQSTRSMTNVKFFLSTGISTTSTAIPYQVYVRAQVKSSTGLVSTIVSRTSTAVLFGLSTENKEVNFRFSNPVKLSGVTEIIFTIVDANSISTPVRFNMGSTCAGITVVNETGGLVQSGGAIRIVTQQ